MEEYLKQIIEMAIDYAPKVAGAVFTILIGFIIAGWVGRIIRKSMEKGKADETLIPFLVSMATIGIKVLAMVSAATMFGFEVTSFVAILGALGLAVGLALQGNLSHMAAGILILFFKPFKVKDFISVQGYSGTVKEIQIFNTIMTTLDNRVIIIPNGLITSGPLENLSTNPQRKVPMTFGIGYTDDIDKARKVIQQVVDACPKIDHSQKVDILISELGDSSVNFAVRPWCNTEDYWDVYFYMHENIKKEFDKASIGIPFPQMDVHMHKVN